MQDNKEEVVEETTQNPEEVINETVFNSVDDDSVIKVDLNNPPVEAVKEDTEEATTEAQEEVAEETTPIVLEEITEEEVEEVEEEDSIEEEEVEDTAPIAELPENIEKLVSFINETGGDINDYVKLNQDYSKLDDNSLLKEYYTQTKPHLDSGEINFLMEDTFSFDEDLDDERDIRRKKLALKEQVANAKTHLEESKSKYYGEIKAGSKLTGEQQKAMDFFNRYNEESEVTKKSVQRNSDIFTQKTEEVFNDKFKGFEYNVGDKKYRFNVKNAEEVKVRQSDINNFTKKFLDKKNGLKDAKGYHKSLYTAMNADAIANHFYEQGKADAIKTSIAKAKNVDMDPRQSHGVVDVGGTKVRVLGDSSNDYKFKFKNKNK